MQEVWIENLKEAIENSGRHRQIVIWGASYKSDRIYSILKNWGFTISGYIDKNSDNISEYNDCPVYPIEKLRECPFFVFVALTTHWQEVLDQLSEMGYVEFVDFWYPRRVIELDGTQDYEDLYGNRLVTENRCPMRVKLRIGGAVEIRAKKLNKITIVSEGDSFVKIGEGVSVGKDTVIVSTGGSILIEDRCKLLSFTVIRAQSGGKICVGERCTMNRGCFLYASFGAKIVLGKDCMVSYLVLIRAGNSHNMIDLNTMENLDDNTKRDVILGEHVWVGMRATLMNGVEIGSGSTVGANTFACKKIFPKNCCIAGNPAKIIRERTAWLRDEFEMHKDIEDYQEFIYDE